MPTAAPEPRSGAASRVPAGWRSAARYRRRLRSGAVGAYAGRRTDTLHATAAAREESSEMQPSQVHIDNNMVLSIVALFFFWPVAIPAVLNAARVNGLLAQGDSVGAQAAADQARRFATIAMVLGLVFWTVFCGVTGCGPLGSGQ
jgi:hypothetical protein